MEKIDNLINDSIFLGTEGISQSKANHVANICKESANRILRKLQNITVTEEILHYDGKILPYNEIIKTNESIVDLCENEAKLYTLGAWLREAIKHKESVLETIKNMAVTDFFTDEQKNNYHFNEKANILSQLTEDDIIKTFSIADYAEYIAVKAKAAHIGLKIHNTGLLPTWYKIIKNHKPVTFIETDKNGGKGMIQSKLLFDEISVDKIFFDLQKRHREYEAKVNYYEAKIKDTLNTKNQEILVHNKKENERIQSLKKEHNTKYESLISDIEKTRLEYINKVAKLKIVIPHSLQPVYDAIEKDLL